MLSSVLRSFPVTEVKVLRYYRTRNSVAIDTQILLKFAFKTQTVCNKNTEILHKFATTTHIFAIKVLKFRINLCCQCYEVFL